MLLQLPSTSPTHEEPQRGMPVMNRGLVLEGGGIGFGSHDHEGVFLLFFLGIRAGLGCWV